MISEYALVKFVHILIAIVALGSSAGFGFLLEFYGDDPTHGPFVLKAIERLVGLLVVPGYVLMLVTGLWLSYAAWPMTSRWLDLAIVLWVTGLLLLIWSLASIRRQRRAGWSEGFASIRYRRVALASRISGGAVGVVVVFILYLMVFKP